jgi:CheY-like chemotaxis protein
MTATICSRMMQRLLIVEDDPHYARVLCDLARDKGFKVLVATVVPRRWRWPGVPSNGVSLDVFLPDMLGWTVLNHLKQDPARATFRCRC